MSAVEKATRGDVFDYHTDTLNDPSAYGTFAQPPYATHLLYPSTLSEDGDQLHYVTGTDFSTQHASFDENRSPYPDPRLRQVPQVTSYTPNDGAQGDRVYVYVQTAHDLLASPALSIFLSFGTKRVQCLVEPLPCSDESSKQYVLSAEVPSFHDTGNPSFTVPLYLVMAGGAASAPQAVEVGAFTYLGHSSATAAPDLSRKRKLSIESEDAFQSSSKRVAGPQLRTSESAALDPYATSATSPYSLPTPTGNVYQTRSQQGASPRAYGHHYSASTASQASIKAPSPHTPSYSPSFATINKPAASPAVSVTPASRPAGRVSPDKSGAPPLVRTSTLPPSAGGASSPGQSFNPYAMYPHKATLKLNGNLDTMAQDWTEQEWEAKRRLVHFTRSQVGSTIHADFKAITPEERQPHSICISCIWWEEKNECYVTSVDTIFLLESLVAVRFTVEEKNRIRRNLEGFRPLTVAKAKPDSDDFFKLIMGFPNPKPRNIEKDVKVFPWKILKEALKKIIGKYSASYSSTAGALSSVPSSAFSAPKALVSDAEVLGAPRMPSSAPAAFGPGFARHMHRASSATSASMELHLQVPTPTAGGYSAPPTFTYPPTQPTHPQTQTPHPMTAPAGRVSAPWDFAPFGAPDPAPIMTPTIQTYTYTRPLPTTTQEYSMPQGSFATGFPATTA